MYRWNRIKAIQDTMYWFTPVYDCVHVQMEQNPGYNVLVYTCLWLCTCTNVLCKKSTVSQVTWNMLPGWYIHSVDRKRSLQAYYCTVTRWWSEPWGNQPLLIRVGPKREGLIRKDTESSPIGPVHIAIAVYIAIVSVCCHCYWMLPVPM